MDKLRASQPDQEITEMGNRGRLEVLVTGETRKKRIIDALKVLYDIRQNPIVRGYIDVCISQLRELNWNDESSVEKMLVWTSSKISGRIESSDGFFVIITISSVTSHYKVTNVRDDVTFELFEVDEAATNSGTPLRTIKFEQTGQIEDNLFKLSSGDFHVL